MSVVEYISSLLGQEGKNELVFFNGHYVYRQ